MWTGSRNLEKPIVRCEYVDNDAAITVPIGCHIIEKEERMTEYGGYSYIKYRLPRGYDRAWLLQKHGGGQIRGSVFPPL